MKIADKKPFKALFFFSFYIFVKCFIIISYHKVAFDGEK